MRQIALLQLLLVNVVVDIDCLQHSARGLINSDENQSTMRIKSDFQGLAHMGTLKLPVHGTKREGDIFSVEDYAGAFQVSESIHDLSQARCPIWGAGREGAARSLGPDRGLRICETVHSRSLPRVNEAIRGATRALVTVAEADPWHEAR